MNDFDVVEEIEAGSAVPKIVFVLAGILGGIVAGGIVMLVVLPRGDGEAKAAGGGWFGGNGGCVLAIKMYDKGSFKEIQTGKFEVTQEGWEMQYDGRVHWVTLYKGSDKYYAEVGKKYGTISKLEPGVYSASLCVSGDIKIAVFDGKNGNIENLPASRFRLIGSR